MSIFRLRVPAVLALAASVGACSLDVNENIPPAVSVEEQQWAPGLNIDLATMTKLASGVYIKDIVIGTGEAVSGAPTVRFYYSGYLASGVQFDSNVGQQQPLEYALAELIPGFTSGLQGMQVQGKRRLIVPSALAYGTTGQGVIPPNANLVFDIELVGII